MANAWSFIAQLRNGATLGDLGPYLTKRTVNLLLNRPSTVTAQISLDAPQAQLAWLLYGQTELIVRCNGAAVETVFVLTDVEVNVGPNGGVLNLEWQSISTYLRDLAVYADTTRNEAQSLHAWNLINTAQGRTGASVYAITRGLIPGTDPVKQTIYGDNIDVLSAIENLSERDAGFDFAVNASRQFDCWYPYRGSNNGLVLENMGGGNIVRYGYKLSAGPGRITTDLTARGGNNGTPVTVTDATAQGLFGRREAFRVYPDNVTGTAVTDAATTDLKAGKQALVIPAVELRQNALAWGSYGLGDTVNLRLRYGRGDFVNLNDSYRVVGISVALNDVGDEKITLDLNEARLVT